MSTAVRTAQRAGWVAALSSYYVTGGAIVAASVLIAGLAAVHLSAPVVLALIAAVPVTAALLRRPELGAVATLVLVGDVARSRLIAYNLPGGLNPTDVLFAATMAAWSLAYLRGHRRLTMPQWPLFSLLALLVVGAVAMVTAHANGTAINQSVLELRGLVLYLLILPLASAIQEDRRNLRWMIGVVGLAVLVSCAQTVHTYIAGGGATFSGDVVNGRVEGDAFLLPMIGLMVLAARLAHIRTGDRRWPWLLAVVPMAVALYETFQRGAWVATIFGIGVMALLLPNAGRRRLLVSGATLALAVTIFTVATTSGSTAADSAGQAVVRRLLSIGDSNDVSHRYRIAEFERAKQIIDEHPVAGIGLGSTITFYSPLYDAATRTNGSVITTYYMHNSYSWAAVKLGLGGLAALVALVGWGAVAGAQSIRSGRLGEDAWVVAAGTAGVFGMLLLSWSGPHITLDRSVAWVAGLLALIVAVRGRPEPGA